MPPHPYAKLFTPTSQFARHLCCDVHMLTWLSYLPMVRNNCGATKMGHVDRTTNFWCYAPCIQWASKCTCQSAGQDHLQRCHTSWMVMDHHENHYGRSIHLPKMYFQYCVNLNWLINNYRPILIVSSSFLSRGYPDHKWRYMIPIITYEDGGHSAPQSWMSSRGGGNIFVTLEKRKCKCAHEVNVKRSSFNYIHLLDKFAMIS